jgi:hypothetical protein
MGKRGRISFRVAHPLNEISLDVTTHIPDLNQQPLDVELSLNGQLLNCCSLFRNGWLTLRVDVPAELRSIADYVLELRASRTWQPRAHTEDRDQRDDREISIAVCNVVVQ